MKFLLPPCYLQITELYNPSQTQHPLLLTYPGTLLIQTKMYNTLSIAIHTYNAVLGLRKCLKILFNHNYTCYFLKSHSLITIMHWSFPYDSENCSQVLPSSSLFRNVVNDCIVKHKLIKHKIWGLKILRGKFLTKHLHTGA